MQGSTMHKKEKLTVYLCERASPNNDLGELGVRVVCGVSLVLGWKNVLEQIS